MAGSMAPLYCTLVGLFGVLCYTVPAGFDSYYEYHPKEITEIVEEEEIPPEQPVANKLSTTETSTVETLINESSYLSQSEIHAAEDYIKSYWQLAYPNHQFQVQQLKVYNETLDSPTPLVRQMMSTPAVYSEDAQWFYEVDFLYQATVTLTTAPQQHPLLEGIETALSSLSDSELSLVSATVERYQTAVADAYQQPIEVTAIYRVIFACDFDPNNSQEDMSNGKYYFHQEDSETNLMPSLGSFATGETRYQQQVKEGTEAVYSLLAQYNTLGTPSRSVTYDPKLAVAYAQAHALDEPEYSAANHLGSDCANFVSFSLNAGGITTDTTGGWYPSPQEGSYGGLNWIRTGFTPSYGGVVLYMSQRNLFFNQNNSMLSPQGSILFFHDHSHVALLTHTDGEIQVFADHSNFKKEYDNFLLEGNIVDYYSPHPQIVVE